MTTKRKLQVKDAQAKFRAKKKIRDARYLELLRLVRELLDELEEFE